MSYKNEFAGALEQAHVFRNKSISNLQAAYIVGRFGGLAFRASMLIVTIPVAFPIAVILGIVYLILKGVSNKAENKSVAIVKSILRKIIVEDKIWDLKTVFENLPALNAQEILLDLLKNDEDFKVLEMDATKTHLVLKVA